MEGIMDATTLYFGARTYCDCVPRVYDGHYMMLEYSPVDYPHSVYFVATVKREPIRGDRVFNTLCAFALQQDAMQYIHRRSRNGTC